MFHPVGTARMGSRDDDQAVVDPELRVRKLDGLRVLDASAMPGPIRGHTVAPTLYVAERGCEIIRRAGS
jgi:choline dehydrogenase